MISAEHSIQSSYREMVLEHLFVGEVMRYCWSNGLPRIDMLKSQVDNSGYDIVLESHRVMRHVQLRASFVGAATARVNVNVELANKPSGCVIWIFFEPNTLELAHFLWFGGEPDEPLPSLERFKIGRHSKGNALGVKSERPNIRYLPKGAFEPLDSIEDVVIRLFGSLIAPGTASTGIAIAGLK
jgi:hypothetical protein